MKKKLRLLNIEDSEDDSLLLKRHLSQAGYELVFERVDTRPAMLSALARHHWDLVISDYVMPQFSSLAALAILKQRGVDIPFIILSGAIGEETAASAMRAGARDYLMKDNLTRLVPAIERELLEAATRHQRKRAEEALRNTEKLATLGRLAATIAHEVNNPLEAVTNILYLLGRHPSLDATARQYVTVAEQEIARVGHIVRQALGFSRGSCGPAPVVIPRMIQNVLDLYGPKMHGVHMEKRFEYHDSIHGVETELRQVFSNLIVNAVEAVGKGGKVRLHVFRSRNWRKPDSRGVRVVVADNGIGIQAEHLKDIFEPFFSTKGDKGTGLGLWISHEIVQKHGGSIRLRSCVKPGHSGTVFSVFLPSVDATENKAKATAGAYCD